MTVFDKEAFRTSHCLPCLTVQSDRIHNLKKPLEKFVAKINDFSCVRDADSAGRKLLVLNPLLVKSFRDLDDISQVLLENQVAEGDFDRRQFEFTSDNWRPHEKLKFILPHDEEGVTGFSRIGHIIHLNLRDNLLPYKKVIGDVLLETKGIRTVLTKTSNIDNTFRNFELEVIAGEKDFQVEVKENGIRFMFDFSKVYWNPRLSTEHERVVKMLTNNSVLFDACAGVGPFSVPAAKKCRVHANDLNPQSFHWLQHNAKLNKIRPDQMSFHNLDARQFIREVFAPELAKLVAEEEDKQCHVVMNLPAAAITFLDVFQGLLVDQPGLHAADLSRLTCLPKIHVYTFSTAEDFRADVLCRVEANLGASLPANHLTEIAFVRNVAPQKNMIRASFSVPVSLLFYSGKRKKLEVEDTKETTLQEKDVHFEPHKSPKRPKV